MKFKFSDAVIINPKEKLKKGSILKKISMQDIQENVRNIKNYNEESFSGGSKFRNKDTLFARITPCLENGKIAQVNMLLDEEVAFGSTEFIVFRAKKEITIPDYVYFLSKWDYVREKAIKSMTGTSGRQRVQNDIFNEITIDIPNLNIQKRISVLLNSFDKKIEVNNKIIANLEEQAQAIFKSWFVDFEPFQDGNFVESELGMIPEGWEVGKLGKSKLGKLIGSGIKEFSGEKIYLATADVSDTNIINESTTISFDSRPSRANMLPKANSVWFAKMKDSRKLILVDKIDEDIIDNIIFSTGFAGIEANEISIYYLWTYLMIEEFDRIKNLLCEGTTMQAINNKNINKILILVPKDEILDKYRKIVEPFFKNISRLKIQNKKHAEIRDALLPKLMSGEIDVSNIKIKGEEVKNEWNLFRRWFWKNLYKIYWGLRLPLPPSPRTCKR